MSTEPMRRMLGRMFDGLETDHLMMVAGELFSTMTEAEVLDAVRTWTLRVGNASRVKIFAAELETPTPQRSVVYDEVTGSWKES